MAHENFAWIEERSAGAEAAQRTRFEALTGDERPWEYIDAVYLTGSIEAIQEKVAARIEAGVEYLMLHTLTADLDQLELLHRHVVAPFRAP